MNQFPHLFEPIRIGKQTVKNRIFMPPLSTNLADKGYVTDALIEHYSNRAKGGVGLIVTEVTTVEPTYTYLPGDMSIYDDSYIPGWKKLVDAVHQYDTKILAQLFHPAYMAFPIPGTPPDLLKLNSGCAFMPRCSKAMKICKDYMPCRTQFSEDQYCSCWEYCKDSADKIVQEQSAAVNG